MNINVDILARAASGMTPHQYPLLPYEIAVLPSQTWLLDANKLSPTQYPSKILKRKQQRIHQTNFESSVQTKWEPLLNTDTINFLATIKVLTKKQIEAPILYAVEQF